MNLAFFSAIRVVRVSLLFAAAMLAIPAHASHLRRGPTSPKSHKKAASSRTSGSARSSARPRAIDDARANEIQTALVKAGYLQTASGHWDAESETAMRKLQGDNGWQTKLIPDSRALIKLGLGPNGGSSSAAAPGLGTTSSAASPSN